MSGIYKISRPFDIGFMRSLEGMASIIRIALSTEIGYSSPYFFDLDVVAMSKKYTVRSVFLILVSVNVDCLIAHGYGIPYYALCYEFALYWDVRCVRYNYCCCVNQTKLNLLRCVVVGALCIA